MIWPGAVSVELLTWWMLALTLKHVVADFLLQSAWMALGKERPTDWMKPLFAHTGIHFGILLAMLLIAAPRFWWLAVVDFVLHSVIDRTKGLLTRGYKLTSKDTLFWWAIGIDQALHHLTGFAFAVILSGR